MLALWWAERCAAQPGEADPEAEVPAINVGLLLGYGATLGDGAAEGEGGNVYGLGFGASGGIDLWPLYLGGRFMFFLGGSAQASGAVVSRDAMTLGIEAGLSLPWRRFTLRPQVGLGVAIGRSDRARDDGGTLSTADASSEDLYIAPGLALLFDLHDAIFIGLDAQLPLIIADETITGVTLLGQAGMRF